MGVADETRPKKDRLAKIIEGLTQPSSTNVERLRNVAAALEMERVVGILDTTTEVVDVVRERLEREGRRYTIAEAAEKAGLTTEQFSRLNLACGFADPAPDELVFTDEDIETMQMFNGAVDFLGLDAALQIVRVIGSSMARCADAFVSAFVHVIGSLSVQEGFTDDDIVQANEVALSLLPTAVRTMDILLRRHLEERSRTDALLLGEAWEGVDALDRVIGFCDLVGYTPLSRQISTEELASVVLTFESDASDLITAKGAHVVKLIGDEVMFVATTAQTGAEVALTLAERFQGRPDVPPVRVGLAAGRVVAREGDYFGPVVNLAARIVKIAPPSTVFASADIRDKITGLAVDDVGREDLKGLDDPVAIVRIER